MNVSTISQRISGNKHLALFQSQEHIKLKTDEYIINYYQLCIVNEFLYHITADIRKQTHSFNSVSGV